MKRANMNRIVTFMLAGPFFLVISSTTKILAGDSPETALLVGFAEADITPVLGEKPVFMAGFGQDRKATKIHDPLMARAVVFRHGDRKLAIVSIDVVGFFYANVLHVRK